MKQSITEAWTEIRGVDDNVVSMKSFTRNIIIMLSAFSLCVNVSVAQNRNEPMRLSSGNFAACSQYGYNALFNNPAGLSSIPSTKVYVDYFQKYTMPELWNVTLGGALKTAKGVVPVELSLSAPLYYATFTLKSGYALNLTDKLAMGLYLHGSMMKSEQAKFDFNLGFSLGSQYVFNEKFSVGTVVSIKELLHKKRPAKYTTIELKSGASYRFNQYCNVNVEISKIISMPLLLSATCEVQVKNHVLLFGGFSSDDNIVCGVTLYLDKFTITVMSSYNFQLGFTPEIMIMR